MIANREALMAEAVAMREDDLTFVEIGEALGIHYSTAHRWLTPASYEKHLRRQRERGNGGPVTDRECDGYGCHAVITADEPSHKRHCSGACRARATRMRTAATAMA